MKKLPMNKKTMRVRHLLRMGLRRAGIRYAVQALNWRYRLIIKLQIEMGDLIGDDEGFVVVEKNYKNERICVLTSTQVRRNAFLMV